MRARAPHLVVATLLIACSVSACGAPSDAEGDGGPGDGDSDLERDDGDVAGGDGDVRSDAETPPELAWGECDTSDWPDGFPFPAAEVECTRVEAPFDHAEPRGATFALTVARHPARTDPGREAVFVIAGGPGGSSVAESGLMHLAIPDVLERFDLIYVDQRGTGRSGFLACPDSASGAADLQRCGDLHDDKDLDHYLSVDAAHDFDLVRRLLGYERISLIGGSYGARLALEYIRQHEGSVQMAVLSGVIAPETDWLGEGVTFFSRAMASLVAECDSSAECREVSPTLARDLSERREALRRSPRLIEVQGLGVLVEDEELFLYILSGVVSDARTRFRIPRAIHDATNGDNAGWNRLMSEATGLRITDASSLPSGARGSGARWRPPLRAYSLGDFVSTGLYMTILCAEYLPSSPGPERLWEIVAEQPWPDDSLAASASACSAWEVGPIDPSLRSTVFSHVPTLLVSGQHDVNTIPEWGERAASALENGVHIVVPHATHLTLWESCPSQIVSDYLLADGDLDAVDTTCLEEIDHPGW